MKKILLSLLAATLAITMVACGGAGGGGTPSAGGEKTYKDTIVWVIGNDQDILDPQTNVSNNKVIPQFYAGLLRVNPEDGKIIPDIAESYEVAEDNLTWTFTLRQDVTFHNGKPVTAHEFEATFDRLLDMENPTRYSANYQYVESAKALDDYTFQIVTKEPKGSFLASIASQSTSVLDPEFMEKYGAKLGETAESVNGAGPYKCASWAKGEEMVFEAHEGYHNGTPLTKNIIMQIVPEQNSRAIAIETGQCDIADGISPEDAVRLDTIAGITVSKTQGAGCHLFQFNVASSTAPMADPLIRQAISYAIDREAICEALYGGLGEVPIRDVVAASVVGYKDMGVVPYDVERAKALLAEAGYADGFEMIIMTTAVYNRGVEMGEILVEQLKAIGITVKLEVIERAVFTEVLNGLTPDQFPYDMFIMGSGGGTDYDTTMSRISRTDPGGTNVNNYGFYSNARVDELLALGAVTVDQAERLAIYTEVSQILLFDDPFGVYMNARNNVYALNSKIENFKVTPGNTMGLATLLLAE